EQTRRAGRSVAGAAERRAGRPAHRDQETAALGSGRGPLEPVRRPPGSGPDPSRHGQVRAGDHAGRSGRSDRGSPPRAEPAGPPDAGRPGLRHDVRVPGRTPTRPAAGPVRPGGDSGLPGRSGRRRRNGLAGPAAADREGV
ncbi:MAG: hypothetical protein AVDCRST_MAG61-349, partial [uncultured Friedmanniella sp.]